MIIAKGCPRCSGDLAYVDDIGDSYYSCVQCGHIVYRLSPTSVPQHNSARERQLPTAVSREEVHRRRIRKQLAARRQAA